MQIILSFYCNILRSYGNFMGVRLEIWRQIFFPIVLWDTLQCHAIRGEGHSLAEEPPTLGGKAHQEP